MHTFYMYFVPKLPKINNLDSLFQNPFYFTMSLCHMANQPIRGREAHTTNLADSTCDDDLFSFIFKKSHENR